MAASVVGRDAELAALRDLLAGISVGAAVLVLEGEAGMGKTTLWRAGLEQAADAGILVLDAQPAESEAELSFAGLGDLLDPVLDRILDPLPAGQRSALSHALVLDEVEGPPPDAHSIGVALLGALRVLAVDEPLLVAVDDVQWLDEASSAALTYAMRRLGAEHVGTLLARRARTNSPLLDELRHSTPDDRFSAVEVGPLDPAALHEVVHAHLGITLPRPLLVEVQQASGGNPLYALEIVRTLSRSGVTVEAGRPLPVPDSLHGLVHGRLRDLPVESREFLAAAAAHAHPTITITERACGVERSVALAPALEAGIVETDGDRIRFTHPLLAAGALETTEPKRRTEIHARLAELLDDPEARAWQLAASVDAPDDRVAATIEEAADHARRRGAPRPAALLLDCAEQLTPVASRDDAVRRAVDAAFLHFEAGDARRAEAKLRDVIAPLPPGPVRARALVVLARVRLYEAPAEARELFLQVVAEAGDDLPTLALAHEGVAACSVWMFKRLEEALQHASVALELATELDDRALLGDVLMVKVGVETILGHPTAGATAERARSLQEDSAGARVLDQPLLSLAECWIWTDDFGGARTALADLLRRAVELGDESARPWVLFLLAEAELALGNLAEARDRAQEGHGVADQTGLPLFGKRAQALEGFASAQLGHANDARTALEQLDVGSDRFLALIRSSALGHLALSLERPDEAVEQLAAEVDFVREERIIEPGAARLVVDLVEALLQGGRLDEAVELLGWYEENAHRLGRVSALANCARCRALLTAQQGDLDAALVAFDEALELHRQVHVPLDRGRTLLALGAAQRRTKRRREARATLEEALGLFEEIGAAVWAERARAELKRISGRAATPGALTPAEERVAVLVAEGKTNKEVAAALFLSDRTVEGHLAHIFGKFGIRHRTEIAGALQTRGIDLSNTGDAPVSAGPSAP